MDLWGLSACCPWAIDQAAGGDADDLSGGHADDLATQVDQEQRSFIDIRSSGSNDSGMWQSVGDGCPGGDDTVARHLCCSVITVDHVTALAQLPCLSSLDLQPKGGQWDVLSQAALQHLSRLSGLRKLVISWGDAEVTQPLADAAAIEQAHGEQLPLQQCLLGLTQLQELELKGSPVVDVVLLQRLQQLRVLKGDALKLVHSDVLHRLQHNHQPGDALQGSAAGDRHLQVQAAGQGVQVAGGAEAEGGVPATAQQQAGPGMRTPKWAVMPALEMLEVVHPASDISALLQGTHTPKLTHMGFVANGPADFARLLGQHGKLRALNLAFRNDEAWHTIAVVRLPTALPSLTSLTLSGKFWLPNSLIVGLGVMDVPLEELRLTCKMTAQCLQRLQHLTQLKRLALHHVPWTGHVAEGVTSKDMMLQLPAALLPPQLSELEVSNGWIQQE
jgi:hypothetical protein